MSDEPLTEAFREAAEIEARTPITACGGGVTSPWRPYPGEKPDADGDYIVGSVNSDGVMNRFDVGGAWWKRDGWADVPDYWSVSDITHWMPIPAPPGEER